MKTFGTLLMATLTLALVLVAIDFLISLFLSNVMYALALGPAL